MKHLPSFRSWVQEMYFANREEHRAFKQPVMTIQEYVAEHRWWLKKQYRELTNNQ